MLFAAVLPQQAVSALSSFTANNARQNAAGPSATNLARVQTAQQVAMAQQLLQQRQMQGQGNGTGRGFGLNPPPANNIRPMGAPTMTPEMMQAMLRRAQDTTMKPP
jgi:hypothetical protein